MARYLMAAAVGPVQDFIAAARRTRDLWFGSGVLSEISRAAAEGIAARGGKLIFPESLDASSIANVILAEVETEDPRATADEGRKRAKAKWRERAEEARREVGDGIDEERWSQQVDDVVEFYAAWVPYAEADDYQAQHHRVMQLLGARKATRDFEAAPWQPIGIRKSSLDGARETVLKPGAQGDAARRKLHLNRGEQLDVVGLTKRNGAGVKGFPSVARIAADPWLRGLTPELRERLAGQVTGLGDLVARVGWTQFREFPLDGAVVYRTRHAEIAEETGDPEAVKDAKTALAGLRMERYYKEAGEPSPYVAILTADGDGMGQLIGEAHGPDDHRGFSQRLAGFAAPAKKIVEAHGGALVYAGGDDVLALLPVDRAVSCAQALRAEFARLMAATLSVGIGIGHFMDPLEDLLEYSREAEAAAKHREAELRGDGIAIHLHTRSGAPTKIRGQGAGFAERMQRLTDLYAEDRLADKAGYDLAEVARKYEGLDAEWLREALPGEAAFVLARKRGSANAEEVRDLLKGATDAGKLLHLADELVVARRLARAKVEAAGRRK